MATGVVHLTGGFTATSLAESETERSNLSLLMQKAGIPPERMSVGGKGKRVEFSASGDETAIRRLRDVLAGRAYLFPGLWTRVEQRR